MPPSGSVVTAGSGIRLGIVPAAGSTMITSAPSGRHRRLAGRWDLPRPVAGAAAEGLSADGSLLVLLADPQTPRDSRFAVVDGGLTEPARMLTLPAGFEFDALAPDGSVLYLIEHLPGQGPDRYAVRSLDTRSLRLAEGEIADKSSRLPEPMAGRPIARAATADGAVVAALYAKSGEAGFVHLLHARDGFAICADLPTPIGAGWSIRADQRTFSVADPGGLELFLVTADGTVHPFAR